MSLEKVITPYNILRHELMGLRARVVDSTDPGYKLEGLIVGESRDMLEFEQKDKIKKVPKDAVVLELDLLGDCKMRISGKLLAGRPVDRIKKKHRIKFV